MRVERIAHRLGIGLLRQIDMRHLAERMHAGIGAAGALHVRALAAERLDRRRKHTLYGDSGCLDLPTGKRRAVIFDQELVARHARQLLSAAPRRRNRRAAQEVRCLHDLLAGALQFEDAHRALSARDGQLVVEHGPGRACAFALVVRKTLARAPSGSSHQAPGNGDRPRMWSCTAFHGLPQSIRVSSLAILAA